MRTKAKIDVYTDDYINDPLTTVEIKDFIFLLTEKQNHLIKMKKNILFCLFVFGMGLAGYSAFSVYFFQSIHFYPFISIFLLLVIYLLKNNISSILYPYVFKINTVDILSLLYSDCYILQAFEFDDVNVDDIRNEKSLLLIKNINLQKRKMLSLEKKLIIQFEQNTINKM